MKSAVLFLHSANLLFSSMKIGQWPIFSGVSLLLSRLVLPPFLHFSPLLSPSLLLWAFELISAGSARCLIGHEAVCEEEKRVFFFFLYPSLFLPLSSNNSIHIISLCVLRFQFCMPVFTVQACVVNGESAMREYD